MRRVVFLIVSLMVSAVQAQTPEQEAQQILDAAGFKGGLIVHLDCGDGSLTAALHANDGYDPFAVIEGRR